MRVIAVCVSARADGYALECQATDGEQPVKKLRATLVLATIIALSACATAQRPVLYPNAHLKNVGDANAQRDIAQCMQMAEDSGVSRSGNQVVKRGAEGAAVGAAAAGVGTLIRGGSAGAGAAVGAAVGGTDRKSVV